MKRRNYNNLIHLELQEDNENQNGAKAQVSVQAGEGRNKQEIEWSFGGAAAAFKRENQEFGGEGHVAPGAASLVNQEYLQEAGSTGGGQDVQKSEQQISVVISRSENVQPVPVLVSRRPIRDNFNIWQLQELERIFQRSHYISPAEGKQLARLMGVTESKVQTWFKRKRERSNIH